VREGGKRGCATALKATCHPPEVKASDVGSYTGTLQARRRSKRKGKTMNG
jgi:hypothetical protein